MVKSKRFLSAILCVVMIVSLLPTSVSAEELDIEEAIDAVPVESVAEDDAAIPEEVTVDVEEDVHEHCYDAVVTEPTCTEYGYTTYYCECGYSYKDNHVDPLNHPEVIELPEIPPTESSTGVSAGVQCVFCGEILSGCEEIPALELVTADEPESTVELETSDELYVEADQLDEPVAESNIPVPLVDQNQYTPPEEIVPTEESSTFIAEEQTATQDAMMTTDTTAPTLSSISLSAITVEAPGSITVTATVQEDISGICNFYTLFYNKEADCSIPVNWQPNATGQYIGDIRVDEFSHAGKYIISDVYIEDRAGNSREYYGEGTIDIWNYEKLPDAWYSLSFTVNNNNPSDTTPPTLSSICLSSTTVEAPGFFTVTANVQDDISGVWYFSCSFYNKETDSTISADSDIDDSGKFSNTVQLDEYAKAGEYIISEVRIIDRAGNHKDYYGEGRKYAGDFEKLPASCYSLSIIITNNNPQDTTPPTLSSISLSPTTVTDRGLITVTAAAQDDYSGVSSFYVYFNNKDVGCMFVADMQPDESGNYTGTIQPDEFSKLGKYIISDVYIEDRAGNHNDYYGEGKEIIGDLERLPDSCYSLAFTVTASESEGSQTPVEESLSTPVICGVENTKNGVTITWSAVSKAAEYRVFRKKSNDTVWKSWCDTTDVSFTDNDVISGNRYSYRIKAMNDDTESDYSSAKTIKFVAAPVISSIANSKNGITLKWSRVGGANMYQVCRRVKLDGTWSGWSIIDAVTGVAFSDTDVNSGTKYQYRLRSLDSNEMVLNTSYSDSKSIKHVAPPAISSVKNTKTGVVIKWSRASGAAQYHLYRRLKYDGSWESWTSLAVVSGNSYTDNSVESGTQYQYRLRSENSKGEVLNSAYSASKGIKYVSVVKISKATNVKTGVTIKWTKVPGASQYRIWRKESGGSWVQLAVTLKGTYTDKTVISGIKYSYRIRPMDKNGNYLNTYSAVKSITFLAVPIITSIKAANGKIAVTWAKSGTATKYRIYRKGPNDTDWVKLGDTKRDTFTDKTVAAGIKYSYAIKAYSSSAKVWSALSSAKSKIAK